MPPSLEIRSRDGGREWKRRNHKPVGKIIAHAKSQRTGRVWTGSRYSCSANSVCSHTVWCVGIWHSVPWDKHAVTLGLLMLYIPLLYPHCAQKFCRLLFICCTLKTSSSELKGTHTNMENRSLPSGEVADGLYMPTLLSINFFGHSRNR